MSPLAFALLLVLLALPLVEIALLIKFANLVGIWPTLAVVIGTAILALKLLREQSFTMFERSWAAISEGKPPVAPVVDGSFMMLAGGLLLAPGLLTDAAGLLLLIPPVRRAVARHFIAQIFGVRSDRAASSRPGPAAGKSGPEPDAGSRTQDAPTTIEGEFERLEERLIDPKIPDVRRKNPPR